jgi:integrase
MQIPLRTQSSVENYIARREWVAARLEHCLLHPSGGCGFSRHGTYRRLTPLGIRIARWYCPQEHRTFSLLPDFLAARLPGLLTSIDAAVTSASNMRSVEAAADALRSDDVSLSAAARWLRRRIRAVQAVLRGLDSLPEMALGARQLERGGVRGSLFELRRTLPLHTLNKLPAPLGFLPSRREAGRHIRLQLDDINWTASTLRVIRPKTGAVFTLPLLPGVARTLVRYRRNGRPPHTTTRHLFVQSKLPFAPLTASSAVRHVVVRYATAAGLTAPFFGSHVLRHSHAARQIDLGADPRVISEILGHRDQDSLSAYVRIATETLRDFSLPVPS